MGRDAARIQRSSRNTRPVLRRNRPVLAATQRPPQLKTCIPVSAYQLTFENCWYNAGALELSWFLSYFVNMAEDVLAAEGDHASIAELAKLKVDPAVRFSALTEDALRHLPLPGWIGRLGRRAP